MQKKYFFVSIKETFSEFSSFSSDTVFLAWCFEEEDIEKLWMQVGLGFRGGDYYESDNLFYFDDLMYSIEEFREIPEEDFLFLEKYLPTIENHSLDIDALRRSPGLIKRVGLPVEVCGLKDGYIQWGDRANILQQSFEDVELKINPETLEVTFEHEEDTFDFWQVSEHELLSAIQPSCLPHC